MPPEKELTLCRILTNFSTFLFDDHKGTELKKIAQQKRPRKSTPIRIIYIGKYKPTLNSRVNSWIFSFNDYFGTSGQTLFSVTLAH